MYHDYQEDQFYRYTRAKKELVSNPTLLCQLEELCANKVANLFRDEFTTIKAQYDEASYLNPFWRNHQPKNRGRAPIGDQVPWIEVGEHVVGDKLPTLLRREFGQVLEFGFPSGPDERFILRDAAIEESLQISDACALLLDIKSVGPRDDQPHSVMSPNQVSGDGIWEQSSRGITNTPLVATGPRARHDFIPAIPPILVLSDGTVAPVVHIIAKVVYGMEYLDEECIGQPLHRIDIISWPNGILLTMNPNYLSDKPRLLFPGKDDKGKAIENRRARISFELLKEISRWRVQSSSP